MVSGATYVVDAWRSDDVAPHESSDRWIELVRSYQCRIALRRPSPSTFRWALTRQASPSYQLIGCTATEIRSERTRRHIRDDPDDRYRLILATQGSLVLRQGDRETALRPGMAALLELSEPFQYVMQSNTEQLVLSIPRREVDERLNRSAPVADVVDLTRGMGRVVHGSLTGLSEERGHLTRVEFDAVCDRLVELVCLMVLGDDRPGPVDRLVELEGVIRRHVRENAADPDLTGATIASELGWSLRQIQVALQRAGTTPHELIREERLRLVKDRLQSPVYRNHSIGSLANLSGFSTSRALSTAFRRRYGMSPRELRSAGQG